MSNGLRLQLEALSKKADRLQGEVVELAEELAEILKPGQFGDWVLVDDSYPPLGPQEFLALQTLLRWHGLEDGPPKVPEECVRLAARTLFGSPETILARAQEAFIAGWSARIALATETEYHRLVIEPEPAEEIKHWVIFYKHSPACNRRVTSSKCLEIALSVEAGCVWQGFKSITELTIFCAGAGDGSESVQAFALPLMARPGGILVAVPDKVLSANLLLDAMLKDEADVLGPSREFTAQLCAEEEFGSGVVDIGALR
eukprot:s591_g22.t1